MNILGGSSGIMAAVMVAAVIAIGLGLGGCGGNQFAAVNQAALADRAAVQSADSLLTYKNPDGSAAPKISVADATKVLAGAATARASLAAWELAVVDGNGNIITTAANAANGALQSLSAIMNNLPAAKIAPATGRTKLALKPATAPTVTGNKKLTPASVVAIIQIAADLSPIITDWINTAFNQTNVTDATVQATLQGLDQDMAQLRAHIAAAGG